MKSVCLIAISLLGFCAGPIYAQTPSWQWAKSGIGQNYNSSQGICSDASGNTYIVGYFESPTITFASITLNKTDTNSLFIVKYDPDGNVIWAETAIGSGNEYGNGISASGVCTDISGNIYMTGSFSDTTLIFGHDTLFNTSNGEIYNVFIVKLDANGNIIWAKNTGGSGGGGNTINSQLCTDINNNLYISGAFWSNSIVFKNNISGDITLYSQGAVLSFFVAKYDANGNAIWAKTVVQGYNYASGVSVDAFGHVFVTGNFAGGSMQFGTTLLYNTGDYDIFLVSYDSIGNVRWAKSSIGTEDDNVNSLSSDLSGNIYITGDLQSPSVAFDSITVTNQGKNMFIAKYDPYGNVKWVKTANGGKNIGQGICTDAIGNLFTIGTFSGEFILGSDSIKDPDSLTQYIFILKCDSLGNVIWAKSIGSGFDYASGICSSISEQVCVTGTFSSSSIIFDNDTLFNINFNSLANSYYGNIFTAKLNGYPTGIPSTNSTFPMTVYPNPSSGMFYFSVVARESTIEIYDLMGQSVLIPGSSPKEEEGTSAVDLSGRPAGVYFYRVTDANNTHQQGKIVVE